MTRRTDGDGSVVVITGASSGIGRAAARAYARRGSRLVLAARSPSALEAVADECRALGGEALAVPADVSVEQEVDDLAAEAVKEYGRIDVWVGNAGVFAYGAFEELPSDVFRQVVETNLMGQVHGARAALSQFRRQGGGVLVMVGSLYSRVGSPAISPYVTRKFGLRGFAETLRQELRGTGITLRVILPGTVDTPIYQRAANVTGRHVRPLPPVSSPASVARAIVRAPRRRRFATYVGRTQAAALPVHDFAPWAYDAVASWLMDHVELHGRGVAATAGTVLRSPGTAGGVTGGWRSVSGRMLVGAALLGALSGMLVVMRRWR